MRNSEPNVPLPDTRRELVDVVLEHSAAEASAITGAS